jgi:tryptophanyl-tRNA synthetase
MAKKEQEVTPWKVTGAIDYERLTKEFGTELVTDKHLTHMKKKTKKLHYLIRRKLFFSHRDLDWLLKEYDKGNPFFLYTGRAPSGPVTLGHTIPWIMTKWLQDTYNVDLWFQFPDEEKFLFNKIKDFEESKKWTEENMCDIIALGFNPKKTHFIVDTEHANLMYKQACRVAKRITFSTAKSVFGFTNEYNLGQIFYTAMQSVPAFLPSVIQGKNIPCLIPMAIDQDAHFRVCRDVMPKLGHYKPALLFCKFLPGLSSPHGKMSSSEKGNAVFMTDTPKEVKKKINKYAFSGGQSTIEEHRKKGGNPDIDTSYQWLTFLEEDDKKLQKIHNDYTSGALLSGELKAILIEKINGFLKKHQAAREKARSKIDQFMYKR